MRAALAIILLLAGTAPTLAEFKCVDEARLYSAAPGDLSFSALSKCIASASSVASPKQSLPIFGTPKVTMSISNAQLLGEALTSAVKGIDGTSGKIVMKMPAPNALDLYALKPGGKETLTFQSKPEM